MPRIGRKGEGRNAVFMAQQGFDVTAVDRSSVGLHKAQALATSRNVKITTFTADLADYDIQGTTRTWDCIVGISCHVSTEIRNRMFRAIPQALAPGGYVVFECYTPRQPDFHTGGPHALDLLYTAQMFQEAFGDTLEIVHNQELVRTVLEGRYHTGKGSVVQFIGRKR